MSSEISSAVLIERALRKTCWPSTTSTPACCRANRIGSSMTSTPSGSSSSPNSSSSRLIFRATSSAIPASGLKAPRRVEMPARAPDSRRGTYGAVVRRVRVGVHLCRGRGQPGVVELVVPRGRAEVPHDGVRVPGEQREPDHLVHRPRADVRRGHVADVGEVESQDRAEVGGLERALQPGEPFRAQAVEGDPALPVDGIRAEGCSTHGSRAFLVCLATSHGRLRACAAQVPDDQVTKVRFWRRDRARV